MNRGVFMYKRACAVFFVFCLMIGVVYARLVIIEESGADTAAVRGHTVSLKVSQSRGMIYDHKLKPLVNFENENYIAVKPSLSSFENVREIIPEQFKNAVFDEISNGRIAVFPSAEKVIGSDALSFNCVKRYADDGLCVHTVGYVNSDGEGVSGIEKYYDKLLNEQKGTLKIVCDVDARSNALQGENLSAESENYNSFAGVALTIDRDIQKICENALQEFNIGKGAAVVLDIKTSEIRGIASVPEFSQNNPASSLGSEDAPFINRAVTPYAVGSVFKVVVSAAALENGIKTSTSYNCAGNIKLGTQQFNCHKKTGHGVLNMYSATAQSCNPYFINLALMTGKSSICEMASNLGLGKQIEICDGWYAKSGILPDAESLVSQQDVANLAFGQGNLLASPLQMAAVYAAIANDGVYRAPSLMQSVIDKNRNEIMRAELPANRRAMSEETAALIKEMLLETVEKGSGSKAKPDGMRVAGKTATAQSGEFDETGDETVRSWFCGFFPYEAPQYAVAVLKEDGNGGSADCAPVFRYIAENVSKK